jgi:hypothetical protein
MMPSLPHVLSLDLVGSHLSALDSTGDEATHVITLKSNIDDDAGDHRDHGTCDKDPVVDLAIGVAGLDVD